MYALETVTFRLYERPEKRGQHYTQKLKINVLRPKLVVMVVKNEPKENISITGIHFNLDRLEVGCSRIPAIIFWKFSKVILVHFFFGPDFKNQFESSII